MEFGNATEAENNVFDIFYGRMGTDLQVTKKCSFLPVVFKCSPTLCLLSALRRILLLTEL